MADKAEKAKTPRRKSAARKAPARAHPPQPEQVADDEQVDLEVFSAEHMKAEKVLWLWPNLLEEGQVNLVQGRKQCGKSSWIRTVAAHVSGGPPLPGMQRRKRNTGVVLWFAGEEGLQTRVWPGLEAAGAVMSRVKVAHSHGTNSASPMRLPADTDRLIRLIRKLGVKLLVLDPIFNFSDGTLSLEKSTEEARRWMACPHRISHETGATVILARNLTKGRATCGSTRAAGPGRLPTSREP